jgi:hypothetical protein
MLSIVKKREAGDRCCQRREQLFLFRKRSREEQLSLFKKERGEQLS